MTVTAIYIIVYYRFLFTTFTFKNKKTPLKTKGIHNQQSVKTGTLYKFF